MRPARRFLSMLAAAAVLSAGATALAHGPAPHDGDDARPRIQMAILLDTSSSMNGLINQARTQLWKVVNELATAKRDGRAPILEVALYEYGKSTIPRGEGHLRQIVPLTTDLDKVSEKLFALTTNGGDEYCGQVIDAAVDGLAWSGSNRDLKMIFIAGNEPFTQGRVNYKDAVKKAIAKGITVSTIHCGPENTGIQTGWKDGALLADGSFMNIDQNARVAHVKAPQDDEIARLGRELNKTYIGYGRAGKKMKARQEEQDTNAAAGMGGASTQRAVTKASGFYKNSHWDLVDAVKDGKVDLKKVDDEALPAEMRKMSAKERKAYVAKMAKKRDAIRAKIKKLDAARKKYVSAERKKMAKADGKSTLDEAMIKETRRQAKKKAFHMK